MSTNHKNIIIISISSDIGAALGSRYLKKGWKVFGTYRQRSSGVAGLGNAGVKLVACDLSDNRSINKACRELSRVCKQWDILVLAAGSQEPIGPFLQTDIDEWEKSIQINFTAQMRMVKGLMATRRKGSKLGPCVLFFSGGGTNNATVNYSAYTVSKIALIKMCELLDAEVPDTRFVILGPGWVKTKIHRSTMKAGRQAGNNYDRTLAKMRGGECTPMEDVLACCGWLITAPRKVVGGRNISVVFDPWGTERLEKWLVKDPDMYKLRRHGNTRLINT